MKLSLMMYLIIAFYCIFTEFQISRKFWRKLEFSKKKSFFNYYINSKQTKKMKNPCCNFVGNIMKYTEIDFQLIWLITVA